MITIWVPKRLVEIDLYNVAALTPLVNGEPQPAGTCRPE